MIIPVSTGAIIPYRVARDALGVLTYINRPDNGGNRDYLSDKYSNFGSELRFIHQYKMSGELISTLLVGTRLYKGLTMRKQGDGNDGSGPDFEYHRARTQQIKL